MWLSRVVLFGTVLGLAGVPAVADSADLGGTIRPHGTLPLSFEANQGQAESQVKFLARGRGYTLFLSSDEAVLIFPLPAREGLQEPADAGVLRMRLPGARSAPPVTGLDELPGKVNYFIDRDPARWRTNVATYARVRYEGVYPGIDLVYHGSQRQLEYDFVVAPGADPRTITLAFDGAERLEIDETGDLVIRVAGGEVRHKKPFVYQERDGVKQALPAAYVPAGPRQVRFHVAAHDATRALVIDPQLVYSTYLGGSGEDHGLGIAVDVSGSAYVTGTTKLGPNFARDFPTTSGAFQRSYSLDTVFVTKLDPSGSAPVYSTFLGRVHTTSRAIAVDTEGNAYVTGQTCDLNFPTTEGAYRRQLTPSTSGLACDAFVTKLNASGSGLAYSTYLGGNNTSDWGNSIAVDAAGNAHVAGATRSPDFPTTDGAFQRSPSPFTSVFVTKLNSLGDLVYSTFVGAGISLEDGRVAIDPAGDAHVAFWRSVVKLNSTGTTALSSMTLQGGLDVRIKGLAVDAAGSAYVTGTTLSSNDLPSDFPTVNPIQPVPLGGLSTKGTTFVAKLDPTGSGLVYSTLLGGTPPTGPILLADEVRAIAVDSSGSAWVTGFTRFSDFPTTEGAFQTSLRGASDAFVVKLDATGTVLLFSSYLGGSGGEAERDAVRIGAGIALDASGDAYVTGRTGSSDFPTTEGAYRRVFGGGDFDAFVTRISVAAAPVPLQFVTFPAALPSLPPEGKVGVPYVGNIGIGGGQPPYAIAVVAGALPTGLRFNSPVITGTPAEILTALFTVRVTDILGSLVEKEFRIAIQSASTVPSLRVALASLPFGSVVIGSSAELTLTVENDGGGTLEGSVAPPGDPFTVISGASFSLGPGQSQALVVRFSPTGEGAVSDALSFTSNGGNVSRTLMGTGVTVVPLTVGVAGNGLGTVRSDPPGIDCAPTCAASYVRGTVVSLAAVAATGSMFVGWAGDGCETATDTCTVAVVEPTSVMARFELAQPDLVVPSFALAATAVTPGSKVSGSVTVENRGGVTAPPSVVTAYVSRQPVRDGTEVRLQLVQRLPALPGNASVATPLTVVLPRRLGAGTYWVLACADGLGRIVEADETNNCGVATTPLEVTWPDLIVEHVAAAPARVRAGTALHVTTMVRNRGTVAAGSSVVRYYLSANAQKDGADPALGGTLRFGPLAPGAADRRTARPVVAGTMPPGRYFVVACADGVDRVTETDETNNCRVSATTVEVVGP